MNRRQWLAAIGSSLVCWHSRGAALSNQKTPKLVWLVLRGAMDGLHAVLPLADSDLLRHREKLVTAVQERAHPLDRGFALHPALPTLAKLYRQKELLTIVATSSGAKTRSHFRAQDILESGYNRADNESGWLNRAVEAKRGQSLAVAHGVPISLRGRHLTQTWYPDHFVESKGDLFERLQSLYSEDDLLSQRLMSGLQTRDKLSVIDQVNRRNRFAQLASSCGTLMRAEDGPDCAMLQLEGWDTHQGQVRRLQTKFSELDAGIVSLRTALRNEWDNTVVIVATEFGRTVAANGTLGTDHGTGSALFLLGGAVAGGRVLGEWPGLKKSELFMGRDLAPTSDNRSWIGAVLKQHWQLTDQQLNHVFPEVPPARERIIKSDLMRDTTVLG